MVSVHRRTPMPAQSGKCEVMGVGNVLETVNAAMVAAYTPGTPPPAITDHDDDGQVVIDLTGKPRDRQRP
jgi:hypothetical protein